MLIKGIITEDFINYKKPSMTIEFPYCSFKCNKECGQEICHNSSLNKEKLIDISYNKIVQLYLNNDITQAIVFQGLEPFDSPHDLFLLVEEIRKYTNDDIVIYTGYYKTEIPESIAMLCKYKNIIIKFGRFIPNQVSHYDKILGINLASSNQYTEKIS